MANSLSRAKLARAAARFSARASLILMTDDDRLPDPLAAMGALPRGAMVIVRAREPCRRARLAQAAMRLAKRHGLTVLIADDPGLAARIAADGVHLPECTAAQAFHIRARKPNWIVTCAAHTASAVWRARLCGADAVLLSPVFPTESHTGRAVLGTMRLSAIARIPIAVYALGGIDARNAARLAGLALRGIAAIGALQI